MKREYLTFGLEEFFLLGRKDALTDGIKDVDEIINSTYIILKRKELLNHLKMYLLGYKIGVLESNFKKIVSSTKFNYKTKSFDYYEKEELKSVSFSEGYKSFLKEATEEATLLLSRRNSC